MHTAVIMVDLGALPANQGDGEEREHNKTLLCDLQIREEEDDLQWNKSEIHN